MRMVVCLSKCPLAWIHQKPIFFGFCVPLAATCHQFSSFLPTHAMAGASLLLSFACALRGIPSRLKTSILTVLKSLAKSFFFIWVDGWFGLGGWVRQIISPPPPRPVDKHIPGPNYACIGLDWFQR